METARASLTPSPPAATRGPGRRETLPRLSWRGGRTPPSLPALLGPTCEKETNCAPLARPPAQKEEGTQVEGGRWGSAASISRPQRGSVRP